MRPLPTLLLGLALALPACKSAAGGDPVSASSRTEPRNPNMITGDQIQEAMAGGLGNAYDLVARLHPNWMRSTSSLGVQVWLDGQRYGGVATLRNISLTALTSIRYLSPSEAQGMLGLDNQGGAITLSTGR